ncbi:MAG: hypothetical protein LBU76_02790, partial [Azoarcus sp.]|nr:hypothetical protein [Azoarcus sp.]
DGRDMIYEGDATAGNHDAIEFGGGVTPDDVLVRRDGDDLVFRIQGTDDQLAVRYYFSSSDAYAVEAARFADGTSWDQQDFVELIGVSG